MSPINTMYTNADQFTTMKRLELLEFVERKKPHIIAICEVKSKIPRERTELDYVVPGYSLHPVNLGSNIGWGIIIYIHSSIDDSLIQTNPDIKFSDDAYSKFDYVKGIIYFLVAFTEVRVLPAHQRKTLLIWTVFLSTYLERNIVPNVLQGILTSET